MRTMLTVITGLGTIALTAGGLRAGPEWAERAATDAGKLPSNAQIPIGSGQLSKIHGKLDGNRGGFAPTAGPVGGAGDFQDMFLVRIVDPSAFSASLDPTAGGAGTFDTQLWLFAFSELGLLANDDLGSVNTLSAFGPSSDDGSGASVVNGGLYYIAVSGSNSDPESVTGPIFDQVSPTEVSGPDGTGSSTPVSAWPLDGATGTYTIALTGVEFASCATDLTDDESVGFADLNELLTAWGACPSPGAAPCPADCTGDGSVGFADLSLLLDAWGPCPVIR